MSALADLARTVASRAVTPAADALGLLDRGLRAAMRERPVWLVAMYHRVLPEAEAPSIDIGLQVGVGHFREQLRFFGEHFTVLAAGEVVERLRDGKPVPPRVASITFDDGYEDNLRVAAPLLAEHGLPWSLYVATGGLVSGEPLWWDRAIGVLGSLESATLDLRDLGLAQFARAEGVPGQDRTAWVLGVLERLWALPLEVALGVLATIEARYPCRTWTAPRRMDAAALATLAAAGVEIGSHTHSHCNLALEGAARARADIERGRHELEALCGVRARGFAYPGGRLGCGVAAAVRDLGIEYALAVDGRINIGNVDRFRIQRVGMPDVPLHVLKLAWLRHLRRGPAPLAWSGTGVTT